MQKSSAAKPKLFFIETVFYRTPLVATFEKKAKYKVTTSATISTIHLSFFKLVRFWRSYRRT